jgi:hypothetical protein
VGISLVKPTEESVRVIAADMRDADAAEVWASHRHTPVDALLSGWRMSDFSVVVECAGVPSAMLGLVVNCRLTGAGTPWLLASNHALKYKREFLLQSPPIIEEMLNICPRLSNHVHADNRVSIRWLKWLGFTIDEPMRTGADDELFHRFHLERVSDDV